MTYQNTSRPDLHGKSINVVDYNMEIDDQSTIAMITYLVEDEDCEELLHVLSNVSPVYLRQIRHLILAMDT